MNSSGFPASLSNLPVLACQLDALKGPIKAHIETRGAHIGKDQTILPTTRKVCLGPLSR